jgi:hypothetical protein
VVVVKTSRRGFWEAAMRGQGTLRFFNRVHNFRMDWTQDQQKVQKRNEKPLDNFSKVGQLVLITFQKLVIRITNFLHSKSWSDVILTKFRTFLVKKVRGPVKNLSRSFSRARKLSEPLDEPTFSKKLEIWFTRTFLAPVVYCFGQREYFHFQNYTRIGKATWNLVTPFNRPLPLKSQRRWWSSIHGTLSSTRRTIGNPFWRRLNFLTTTTIMSQLIGVSPFKANYCFNPFKWLVSPSSWRMAQGNQWIPISTQVVSGGSPGINKGSIWQRREGHPKWEHWQGGLAKQQEYIWKGPSSKLDHRWLGPFLISKKLSQSATLPTK